VVIVAISAAIGCANSDYGLRAGAEPVGLPSDPPLTPTERLDEFVQAPSSKSDVLFVVDSSGSMNEEQEALATNFPALLDWFVDSGVDYHIGVVSTDMYDPLGAGQLRQSEGIRFLTPETPEIEARFADLTRIGTEGANDERGRAAAYTALALRADEANAGFLRDDAALHLIVVSDEDDNSGPWPITETGFVDFLLSLDRHITTFSSIVGPPTLLGGNRFDCRAEPGIGYLELTRRIGGVAWSICEDDWVRLLDELGFVTVGLRRSFSLRRPAEVRTVRVELEVDGEAREVFGDEWSYVDPPGAVRFGEASIPPPGAIVRVRYTVDDGS